MLAHCNPMGNHSFSSTSCSCVVKLGGIFQATKTTYEPVCFSCALTFRWKKKRRFLIVSPDLLLKKKDAGKFCPYCFSDAMAPKTVMEM